MMTHGVRTLAGIRMPATSRCSCVRGRTDVLATTSTVIHASYRMYNTSTTDIIFSQALHNNISKKKKNTENSARNWT